MFSASQPVRKLTASSNAHYSCMIPTTHSKGNGVVQPGHVKPALRTFLFILLLAMLTACNQLASQGVSELDGADLTPGELTFTSARAATVRELTLHNDDAAPVEITSAKVLGTDASSFALADTPQFPIVVAPDQQVTLKVRFTPQAKQDAFRAALHLTGDKPGRSAVEVRLYGEIGQGTNEPPAPADEGWTSLFDGKNLDGWYTWLPSTGKNNDPKGVFKADNGMLHILDIPVTGQKQEFGYIARPETFKNYRLRFEYKWGQKRFKPRNASKRDSGLLYNVVGPDKVWPRSIEFQIQEGDTGDFWLLGGTTTTTTVTSASTDSPEYQERGEPYTSKPGSFVRLTKSHTYDKKVGWNKVEVIVTENEAIHIVNGKVNNRGTAFMQPDPKNPNHMIPLNEGRILFQAEGAEVFYRNIEIKSLD